MFTLAMAAMLVMLGTFIYARLGAELLRGVDRSLGARADVLASTSAAGWLVAGAALRPVERIRRRAARLSHTDSRARLPVPRTGDELARLAVTLNEVLARLHAAVEREHRFVDQASHELRTPLAVLKAELDLASSRHRSAEELQVTVAAAGVQTNRLIQLAEDLLVLARARQSPIPPRRVPTHLPTLLHEVAASLRARTAPDTEAIQVDADDVTVDIDPDQVHRAVRNLLDNALRHGDGEVLLTGRRHNHGVRIEVEDHGPGFPPALLASAFEPFTRGPATPARTDHRPGPSRARPRPTSAATAHRHSTGLGLAIVRSVAAAHGGTATATNADHGGARVRLHLMT